MNTSNAVSYLPDGPLSARSLAKPISIGAERATLTVLAGRYAGRMLTLDETPLLIGSAEDVDLQVDDAAVSRHHARVLRGSGGRFFLEDLGSSNGTFVCVRRIDRAPLASGDVLQIGPALLLRFAAMS